MNTFTRSALRGLAAPQWGWCLSLYLPTHRSPADTEQDRIQFKNLLREAETQLTHTGLRTSELKDFLAPAWQILTDGALRQPLGEGLALYLNKNEFHAYYLPLSFEPTVVVSHRFHLRPLLPLFTANEPFYLLALSQAEVHLWQGTLQGLREIPLKDVPHGLDETLQYDEIEKQHQFHTIGSPGRVGPIAVTHGQGFSHDATKERLHRYVQQIDRGIHQALRDEKAPLVLAAVEYLMPLYREVNTYPHLLHEGINGNPQLRTPGQLYEAAQTILQPHFMQAQREAIASYQRWNGTARASHDAAAIVRKAHLGQIESLLVARDASRWGNFNRDTQAVVLHATAELGDEDLLDFAAVQVITSGGKVFCMEAKQMPTDTPMVAVFRYS